MEQSRYLNNKTSLGWLRLLHGLRRGLGMVGNNSGGDVMMKAAIVSWTSDDIQTLKPEWSHEQCEQWLSDNEHYIQDAMIEKGWEIIESLL